MGKDRKPTPWEFDCAQGVLVDARDCIGDLFPKAKVEMALTKFGGAIGVAARIIGDPIPHTVADIVECLGDLGVQQVTQVELQAQPGL